MENEETPLQKQKREIDTQQNGVNERPVHWVVPCNRDTMTPLCPTAKY